MTTLSNSNLALLAAAVPIPAYDRRAVTAGIVHIGVGGFHRSHQAAYLDDLMNRGEAMDWGICGVGLKPSNVTMRDALAAQDCLYTLVLRHNDGTWKPRVIGSIVDYLFAPDDSEAVVERMADPNIKIVSLTVTEGGYNIDATTGGFQRRSAQVVADLAPGATQRSLFGLVVEALSRRRQRGIPAFSMVSCDNIQGNGDVCRRVFTTFAELRDPDLAVWINEHVAFPNSMVDRITPQTTDEDIAALSERFGVQDRWPVLSEPFTQWVMEDEFSAGRPPFDHAGVQLVADVQPYEQMKLRLLNASHQALCYPGYLVGYRLVHEVVTDALFAQFLLDYMTMEAIPTLQPVPGVDLNAYVGQLIQRFSNSEVRDTVARLCANTSDLIPKFLLPVIRDQLAAGRPITRSVAVIACWARYAEGTDENGETYVIDDVLEPRLRAAAARQDAEPTAFLHDNRTVFGELVDDPRFVRLYTSLLTSVRTRGVRETLATLDTSPQFADRKRSPTGGISQ